MIQIEYLEKTFKMLNRKQGIKGAFSDLFSKDYNYVKAVDDISLNIKKGEIMGYIGPNGAGKSTIEISFINIIMFFVLTISASLICMALMISSSALGFLGGGSNSLMFLASDLKVYAGYPLTIFNKFFKILFTFLIPIGFIAYYPAQYFLTSNAEISILTYLSPVISIIFFWISCKIWIRCADNYSGTGS